MFKILVNPTKRLRIAVVYLNVFGERDRDRERDRERERQRERDREKEREREIDR